MSSDLTFLTNEPGKSLLDRFHALLGAHTRFFDCLVGYFMISGFYKLYPVLEHTEKIRILIGIKTDQSTHAFLQQAKDQQQLLLSSHAEAKSQIPGEVLSELEQSDDSAAVEEGVDTFISWVATCTPCSTVPASSWGKQTTLSLELAECLHRKQKRPALHRGRRTKGHGRGCCQKARRH